MQAPSLKPQQVKAWVSTSLWIIQTVQPGTTPATLTLPACPHCPQAGHGQQGVARLE